MFYLSSWLPGAGFFKGKDLYIGIALGLIIIFLNFDFNNFLNYQINFKNLEKKLLSLIIFFFLISTVLYNPGELSSAKSLLNIMFYVIVFFVYFVIIPGIFEENNDLFEKFLKVISNFGLIFSIIGLVMIFINFHPVSDIRIQFVSLLKHPNLSSKILTVTVFTALIYLYLNLGKFTIYQKYFYIVSISIQFITQFMTFDRAGIFGTLIGLLIFFGFLYRNKIIILVPFFAAGLGLLATSIFRAKGFGTVATRLYLLIPAYEMIFRSKDKMLWGYGLTESFKEYSKNLLVFYSNEPQQTDPHNSYVLLIMMIGAIATAAILVFIFYLIYKCIRRFFSVKNNYEKLKNIFLVSSLVALMIQALFDGEIIRIDHFTVHYILIVLGLMYISAKKSRDKLIIKNQLVN